MRRIYEWITKANQILLFFVIIGAGYEAVKPKAKGANLIHAEIVRNLQTASLVLCDMSGLNPNVFFELGIRTAMNKPICLVIDEATKNSPFDLDLVNHHAYVSDLRPWVLPGEIEKLATHIKESAKMDENALWKYFSLRIAAEPTTSPSNEKTELNLLRMEIEALRRESRVSPMLQKTMFTGFTDHDDAVDIVRSRYAGAKSVGLSEPKIHIDRHGLEGKAEGSVLESRHFF